MRTTARWVSTDPKAGIAAFCTPAMVHRSQAKKATGGNVHPTKARSPFNLSPLGKIGLGGVFVLMPLKGQLDQAIDQLGIGQSCCLP